MLYQFYEWNHAALAPMRLAAEIGAAALKDPENQFAQTPFGKAIAASLDVFEGATRRYGKPAFNLDHTFIDGKEVPVLERVVWEKNFCELLHFERAVSNPDDPKLLIVAPMSGHYATLLRGTVEALLPHNDVYITDWADARSVPVNQGTFDLDDYIDYIIELCELLGPNVHILAVCQPSVPVLAATALMNEDKADFAPRSMTLMGGPIDTRLNETEVNKFATNNGYDWFENNVVMEVPLPNPGFTRRVYPGFLQLSGFMSMNLDKHVSAQWDFFSHLVEGDGDSADKHRAFYDEYLSVMDLPAEYYLQTIRRVFVEHHLPLGIFHHRDRLVDLTAIDKTALMTVEGENDDVSGIGQTMAAHVLCSNIPETHRAHYEQEGVGHYGVFNGAKWEQSVAPRVNAFIRSHDQRD